MPPASVQKPASFTLNRDTVLRGYSEADAAPVIFSTEAEQNGNVYALMRIVSNYKHVRTEPVHIVDLPNFGNGNEEIRPVSETHPQNGSRCWFTFVETVPVLFKLVTQKVLVRADITIPASADGDVPRISVYRAFVHHEPGDKGEKVEVRRVRRMQQDEAGVKVTEEMTVWVGWYLHWLTKPISQRSLDDTVDGLITLFDRKQKS